MKIQIYAKHAEKFARVVSGRNEVANPKLIRDVNEENIFNY